jgi:hypothetical protein
MTPIIQQGGEVFTGGNRGNGEMTRQIGPGQVCTEQPKQNDAPNHAADTLSLAFAIATVSLAVCKFPRGDGGGFHVAKGNQGAS